MDPKEELIQWLRDAYAMERGLEVPLEKQVKSEDLDAATRQQVQKHLEETRKHAEMVKVSIEALGADVSAVKAGMAKGMEMAMGLGTAFARDEKVKDMLSCYAAEHFEIACYEALRAAAEALEIHDVVEMCDLIIPEEESMALWIRSHLPDVVESYLGKSLV